MRCAIILLFAFTIGCDRNSVKQPTWINANKIIYIPTDTLLFHSIDSNWTAYIAGFIQPIPLNLIPCDSGFKLITRDSSGIIEGNATLVLTHKQFHFFYPVYMHNRNIGMDEKKDYRSPKTVNPDSSLKQHQMIHLIDQWRNLTPLNADSELFFEQNLMLGRKAATYRAQKDIPLSAYYVQPGSCVNIPIHAITNRKKKVYEITAGPLYDRDNNVVADGTKVIFYYEDGKKTYQREVSLLHGIAQTEIAIDSTNSYVLMAKVNYTASQKMILNP